MENLKDEIFNKNPERHLKQAKNLSESYRDAKTPNYRSPEA